MNIEDRVAIVTGAAAGIGRATAVALAEAGARGVVLADVDEVGLSETASAVEKAGAKALVVSTDVTSVQAQRAMFAAAQREFGQVDIVHNNAGLTTGTPSWPECSLEIVTAMSDVNLKGVLIGTRLAIDAMAGRGGVIVNTSSIAGQNASLQEAAYCATKAGVIMLTQACAPLAETHGIRVNCVCPGMTDTPMLGKTGVDGQLAEYLKPLAAEIELVRPEEIAAAVLDFVRDDSQAGGVVTVANQPKGAPA